MTRSFFAAIAATVALSFAPIHAPSADTLVLLVRHAEKVGPSGDVALSAAGEARAKALVEVARDAKVSAIVTTQFLRTRQTAAPTAEALGLTPVIIAASANTADHVAAVVRSIREQHAGQTVLVVGHSNTVPAIASALGAPRLADLCDSVYDALLIVAIASDGATRLVRAHYGAPTPADTSCPSMR
jgi:broad specificity phosphatase PhoE